MDNRQYHRYISRMRKTTLEIDDEVLEEARAILGTSGIKDTIDAALNEILAFEARRRDIERMTTMRGLDLDDPEVMAQAWR